MKEDLWLSMRKKEMFWTMPRATVAKANKRPWLHGDRDKSKDAEKRKKQRMIKAWLKEHPVVGDALEEAAWDIVKRNVPPETKIDTKLVKSILKENNLELEGFSARDLLSVWKKN